MLFIGNTRKSEIVRNSLMSEKGMKYSVECADVLYCPNPVSWAQCAGAGRELGAKWIRVVFKWTQERSIVRD